MLEHYFRKKNKLNRLRTCLLGLYLDPFACYLNGLGYLKPVVVHYVSAAGHLAHWLAESQHCLDELDEQLVQDFLEHHLDCCSCPDPRPCVVHILRAGCGHFLSFLRQKGTISTNPPVRHSPFEQILDQFDRYMLDVCGLATNTRCYRIRHARAFLEHFCIHDGLHLESLRAEEIRNYVAERAQEYSRGSAKVLAGAVRSFLRYLQFLGLCSENLVASVPSFAAPSQTRLPQSLSTEQLKQMFSSFDRSHASGLRDYAMALCMLELGLRSADIVAVTLADIDWRVGTVVIHGGKGRRSTILPLPANVGQALVDYLRHERPQTDDRHLFVRHAFPRGKPISTRIVQRAIESAFKRVEIVGKTPHSLRHTTANRLLQGGASLKEVADVLRHRSLNTTTIYARINRAKLDEIAMPWPEVKI